MPAGDGSGNRDLVLLDFFAQGGAVQTEDFRGPALVAAAVQKHFLQQRGFDFGQQGSVQVAAGRMAHVLQVAADAAGDHVFQAGLILGVGCGVMDEMQRIHVMWVLLFFVGRTV